MFYPKEHEIAESILKDVLAKAQNAGRISGVHIMVGEISEIRRDLFRSDWKELTRDTLAEGAQIHFHIVPADVQCMACFQKYHPEGGEIHCPHCGSFGAKILSGEEIFLESIEMENE